MSYRSRMVRLTAACAVLGSLAVPLAASADSHETMVMPFATDLARPRGLAVDANGSLLVAVEGTGDNDGAVMSFRDLDGNGMADNGAEMKYVASQLPSALMPSPEGEGAEVAGTGGVAVGADGAVYAVQSGFQVDPLSVNHGTVWSTTAENTSGNPLRTMNPYASITAAEHALNPDGDVVDSNPYSIVVDADGVAYVNDAGANATFMVAEDGTVTPFAVYPPVEVPADYGLPFPVTHFVPTGIAMDADGTLFVGGLTGFPFSEGAAMIYRLEDANGDGDAMDAGEMTVYAEGLTTVTALAIDNNGDLLAAEFRSGLSPFDEPSMGRVVRISDGGDVEVVADGFVSPTGLAVGNDGEIYVAQEFLGMVSVIHE